MMKPTAKRPIAVLAICAACTLVFLVLWWRGFVPLQELELFAQDWQTRLGRKTPVDERLVLLVLWWRGFVPLQELELFAQDWQTRLGRKTPVDERLVLLVLWWRGFVPLQELE